MNAPRPDKLAVPLAPLLPRLELDAAKQQVIEGAETASEAVRRLAAAEHLAEAARLCAHALPKREAVWWACMCARGAPDPASTEADRTALEAAEAWVRRPQEEARRATMAAANATSFQHAEPWAAMGAFWSGGSMAPEGQPAVPPAEHLTGVAVAGAVMIASVRVKPQEAMARLRRFIASAQDIATGGAGRIEPQAGG